jgi:hypothetical protein
MSVETPSYQPLEPLGTTNSSQETLVAVLDAELRIVMVDPRLGAGLPGRGLEAERLPDLIGDAATHRRLRLVSRGLASEVFVAALTDGQRELVARPALAPNARWIILQERPVEASAARALPAVVGRETELVEFERFLGDDAERVLYVCGPLGMGKSALLGLFAHRCKELGASHFWIDASSHVTTEDAITRELSRGTSSEPLLARLFGRGRHLALGAAVLLVDNFDAWQRQSAAIERSLQPLDGCKVVVAARALPDRRWWEARAITPRLMNLESLGSGGVEELALRRGVPHERVAEIIENAGGHPLSIVTHAAAIRADVPESRLGTLLSLDLSDVGDRETLEAAALPARITEDVLAAILEDPERAAATYEALATICLPDPSGVGMRMPPLFRKLLRARLRERNPARLASLSLKLADHYGVLLERETPAYLFPVVDDLLDAFADHPMIVKLVGSPTGRPATARRAGTEDLVAIMTALEPMAGRARAEAVARRLEHGHVRTYVAEAAGTVVGVCQSLTATVSTLERLLDDGHDGDISAAADVLRRAASDAPFELSLVCVAWFTSEGSAWGPVCQTLFREVLPELLTSPEVTRTVLVLHSGHVPPPTVAIPGLTAWHSGGHDVLLRDVRHLKARQRVAALLANAPPQTSPSLSPPLSGVRGRISPEVVRQALQHLDDVEWLSSSPLASLKIVEAKLGGAATPVEKATAVRQLLESSVASLAGGPREHLQRAAISAVFVTRGGKHEQIASDLGLSYSTFRRYVTRGLEHVAEYIRAHEEKSG